MRIDTVFTPAELGGDGVGERTVVVIDVLRATTSILVALANGARDVVPVESVEQAVRKADAIGRDTVLLCGERDVDRIPGFDLGNSPLEFIRERVAGRTLVMTTTNGTRALLAGAGGSRCIVGSMLNAGAVADALLDAGEDVLVVCAGREGRFALEDAVCAGLIARRAMARTDARVATNDACKSALLLASRYGGALDRFLPRTAAGRILTRLGREEEVAFCARLDAENRVPRMHERRVTL